jgi:hypothetical protein
MNVIEIQDWAKEWVVAGSLFNVSVLIGRGKDARKFVYNESVPVFAINTALEFYEDSHYVVMVQAHFKELQHLPMFENSTIIHISKIYMKQNGLVPGCTPSIFLSFLIQNMKSDSTIYLQGFSMDETCNTKFPSPIPKSRVYDWSRQVEAFRRCQTLADAYKINLILIDKNTKLPFMKNGVPKMEHLHD